MTISRTSERAEVISVVPHWYMYPPKTSYSDADCRELIESEIASLAGQPVGIYVHIPFCNMKCSFCSLFTSRGHSDDSVSSYVGILRREIANFHTRFPSKRPVASVLYFGGGTPALLPEKHIYEILEQLNLAFDMSTLFSRSVEFSPDVVDDTSVAIWRKSGFDRASLGVQTFDDLLLHAMSRRHTAAQAGSAIKRIADAGYSDINVDLIFGHNQQTGPSWQADLDSVVASSATHCTFHPLATRPKTALERKAIAVGGDAEDLQAKHAQAISHFQAAGWMQTSAISCSRISKPNPLESAEAAGQPTIGFGAGSRSYYPALHTSTAPYTKRTPFGEVLQRYSDAINSGSIPFASHVVLTHEEQVRRSIILQMHHGQIRDDTLSAFKSSSNEADAYTRVADMVARGWLVRRSAGYELTVEGLVRAAEIGLAFSSPAVQRTLSALT